MKLFGISGKKDRGKRQEHSAGLWTDAEELDFLDLPELREAENRPDGAVARSGGEAPMPPEPEKTPLAEERETASDAPPGETAAPAFPPSGIIAPGPEIDEPTRRWRSSAAGAVPPGDVKPVQPARDPAQPPQPESPETPGGVFSQVWDLFRRHRRAFTALGICALVLLSVLAVHAVLVRAPSVRDDGLQSPAASVRPAVTGPIATPPPTDKPETAPEEAGTDAPTQTPATYRRESCYTFALLVIDQISGSTDTVLTGRLDTDAGTLDLVSLPRDTLVNVSWPVKKLNTVYSNERNDPERFLDHLSRLTGFRVDHYAVMSLRAVETVVDALGGVDYDIPMDMDYDDPGQGLSIHLSAGLQHLSGADVVKALRYRMGNDGSGYSDGDLGRIRFQQELLGAVASNMLRLGNIPNLTETVNAFLQNVKTDFTAVNLSFFAAQFLRLERDGVRFHTAPGSAVTIRGGSYYELDLRNWAALVNDALNPYSTPVSEQNLDILLYLGPEGAISTTGESLPLSRFYDFRSES